MAIGDIVATNWHNVNILSHRKAYIRSKVGYIDIYYIYASIYCPCDTVCVFVWPTQKNIHPFVFDSSTTYNICS